MARIRFVHCLTETAVEPWPSESILCQIKVWVVCGGDSVGSEPRCGVFPVNNCGHGMSNFENMV